MKTVILYGTTEGQTRKVAEFAATELKKKGDDVTVVDAAALPDAFDVKRYDLVVIAASLHAGHFQTPVVHAARHHREALNGMFSVFLPVSLSAASNDPLDRKGLDECVARFQHDTGWSPHELHHIAGAFRFAEYDYFKRWAMRLIAWDRGIKVDPSKDLELTDWKDLAGYLEQLHASAASQTALAL